MTNYIKLAKAVIQTEAAAIDALLGRIDATFEKACELIIQCQGRVVVTGMGKSGHIGHKIAATLASTGTPAFFMHPGEASHGDLGMLTTSDVVIALSNSGETAEIKTLVPLIKRLGIPLISFTGISTSSLAQNADVNLNVSVEKEACPLGLAPTSSTTAAIVMGDALAVALLDARGFTEEDFARSHPGGSLGRKLLLHVADIMHSGDALPVVSDQASLQQALVEMTQKGLGMTAVVDQNNKMVGVYTDGDLRRSLDDNIDVKKAMIKDLMSRHCTTCKASQLAAEIVKIMQDKKINSLPVVDDNHCLVGALNMHDLLRSGVV